MAQSRLRRLADLEAFHRRVTEGCILCGSLAHGRVVEVTGVQVCDRCLTEIHAAALRDAEFKKRDERRLQEAELADKPTQPTLVYFAQLRHALKIGISKTPRNRVTSFGARLVATEPGGRHRETELHEMFDAKRIHREWFDLDWELELYIEALPTFQKWAWPKSGGRLEDVSMEAHQPS